MHGVTLDGEVVWQHDRMIYDVLVEVSLREGVADPQGSTIERVVPTLGFEGVTGVRVGKSIRFSIDADDEDSVRSQVQELCDRFLTNPVIEDSAISIQSSTDPASAVA